MNSEELEERLEELHYELQEAEDTLSRAEADLNDNDGENVTSPEYVLRCKSDVNRVKRAIAEISATTLLEIPAPLINDRDNLDGCKVRTLCDILDNDGNILVADGETFTWSESADHQFICGEYIWVDPNEVEIVGGADKK